MQGIFVFWFCCRNVFRLRVASSAGIWSFWQPSLKSAFVMGAMPYRAKGWATTLGRSKVTRPDFNGPTTAYKLRGGMKEGFENKYFFVIILRILLADTWKPL